MGDHTAAFVRFVAAETGTQLCFWLLDNSCVQPTASGSPAVKAFAVPGPGRLSPMTGATLSFAVWDPDALAPSTEVATATVMQKLEGLVEQRKSAAVVDFEEHLE